MSPKHTAHRVSSEKRSTPLDREQIYWALRRNLLEFGLLIEDDQRVQVDRIQKKEFGVTGGDAFEDLDRCRGKALLCSFEGVVLGYQAFDPDPRAGNPFGRKKRSMRFTFLAVRDDEMARARGMGIARELLKRSLDLAWSWDFQLVYTYTTAYEALEEVGFKPMGGKATLWEAKHVRDMDPEQAPPILVFAERPEGHGR